MKALETIIGRNKSIFYGSVGQAVSKEIIKRNPIALHVVDINENNLVELVRDIRSSNFNFNSDFKTFPLDIGSKTYDSFFLCNGNYDYVINLSAIKHVRSEKDLLAYQND